MFLLASISDLVQVAPQDLGKSLTTNLEDFINGKYCNRVRSSSALVPSVGLTSRSCAIEVIKTIGLCISLFDVTYVSDGRVATRTGTVNLNGRGTLALKEVSLPLP